MADRVATYVLAVLVALGVVLVALGLVACDADGPHCDQGWCVPNYMQIWDSTYTIYCDGQGGPIDDAPQPQPSAAPDDAALAPLWNYDGLGADPLPTGAIATVLREPVEDAAEHCVGRCTPEPVASFTWADGVMQSCLCLGEL